MKVAKKRFHVSIPKSQEKILVDLSNQDGVPLATKASELLIQALSWHEDAILLERLENRRKDSVKFVKLEDNLDSFNK